MAVLKREEKEIPIIGSHVTDPAELAKLCLEHRIRFLSYDLGGTISLILTESSEDLPVFAKKVAAAGLFDRMPEEKRAAYLHDVSTLECP